MLKDEHYTFIIFISDVISGDPVLRSQVEAVRDQAQLALAQYSAHTFPATARFGRMLLTLPTLRSVLPAHVQLLFFPTTDIPSFIKAVY